MQWYCRAVRSESHSHMAVICIYCIRRSSNTPQASLATCLPAGGFFHLPSFTDENGIQCAQFTAVLSPNVRCLGGVLGRAIKNSDPWPFGPSRKTLSKKCRKTRSCLWHKLKLGYKMYEYGSQNWVLNGLRLLTPQVIRFVCVRMRMLNKSLTPLRCRGSFLAYWF